MSKSFDEWYKDQKEFQKEWAEQELGIVRCKDCKHWFYFIESEKHHCTESDKHLWDCPIREDDDFCSRGERK